MLKAFVAFKKLQQSCTVDKYESMRAVEWAHVAVCVWWGATMRQHIVLRSAGKRERRERGGACLPFYEEPMSALAGLHAFACARLFCGDLKLLLHLPGSSYFLAQT